MSLNDWPDLFCRKVPLDKKLLTIDNEVRSLVREKLKIRSDGGEKQVGR